MSKSYYDEVRCGNCGYHVCYMVDCGPRGTIICDSCYESEDSDEDDHHE